MTAERAPADQAARKRAVESIDASVFLEAGAGAGKTRVMVDRIVRIVRSGRAELRQIVAITFTEKAAGELRSRIRRALNDELRRADSDRQRDSMRLALEQIDSAHIETIHSFCSSLIRERPFDAQIDPYYDVLAQLAAGLDFDDAWDQWLWQEHGPAARDALAQMLEWNVEPASIREAALAIESHRDLEIRIPRIETADPRAAYAEWRADADAIAEAYQREGSPTQNRAVAEFTAALDALADDGDDDGADDDDGDDPDRLARRMTAFNPKPPDKRKRTASARDLWDAAAERRNAFAGDSKRNALADLLDSLRQFAAEHAENRAKAGNLSFDDLLLGARNLIRDREPARDHFRRRYKTLLIDEFQDTDPLQAELVMLLAAEQSTGDWLDATPAPGRLFVVGDPKQSIYRFRRADIDIYEHVKRIFQNAADRGDGAIVERLDVNFRSTPALVQWANRAFDRILVQEADDQHDYQAEFSKTRHHRDDAVGGGVIVVDSPEKHENVGEARDEEALLLASLVRAILEGGQPFSRILDAETGEIRTASPRDIALLVRTRTEIERLTDVFDSKLIPYHLDSGRGFFTRGEVRDLTSILMALDDPADEVAIAAALKSPIAAASDQDLFDYVWGGEELDDDGRRRRRPLRIYGEIPDHAPDPVRRGLELLNRLQRELRSRSLPQFVEHVLRESRLLDAQFLHGARSDDRAANLQTLVLRAAEFADAQGDSLRPFVQWLAQRQTQDLSEAESPTSEVAGDVVRIMTIHQAKGLEYPIVILPKLAAGNRPDNTKVIVNRATDPETGRPGNTLDIQIGRVGSGVRTPGFDKEIEKKFTDAEERRILYVAATRAKDWLILPKFDAKRNSKDSFYSILDQAGAWDAASGAGIFPASAFDAFNPEPPEPLDVDHRSLHEQWGERRMAALASGAVNFTAETPSRKHGDLAKTAREDHAGEDDDTDDEPRPGDPVVYSREDALRFGSAVHRCIELAGLDALGAPDAARPPVQRIAKAESVDPGNLAVHLDNAFRSELLQRAAKAEQHFLEMPLVSARIDGDRTQITEGIADLAFRETAGWIIVDFKSDRPGNAARARSGQYQEQIREYARMLRESGQPVAEAWLLYTATGTEVRVPLDD